jgi:hypothetical protein
MTLVKRVLDLHHLGCKVGDGDHLIDEFLLIVVPGN